MFPKLSATLVVSCLLASSPVFAASLEDFRCTISTDGGHDRQEIVPDFDHGEIVTDVTAHDYKGRTVTSIWEEKRHNPRIAGKSRDAFIEVMNGLKLPMPKLLDQAVPANRACGRR